MGLTNKAEQRGNLVGLVLLKEVTGVLNVSQLPYYVVGNYAIDAFTGQNSLSKQRPLSEISTDIDILTPDPVGVREKLEKEGLKEGLLRKLHFKGRRVDLGINSVIDLRDVDEPCLCYRSIRVSLPKEIFTVVWGNIGNVDFPTLPPETLIHLYALSWHLGKENKANIAALRDAFSVSSTDKEYEGLYNGFYRFNQERRERYPLTAFTREYLLRLKYQLASIIYRDRERCR